MHSYLSSGASIYLIIHRQKNKSRGFDNSTCQKVLENHEKARYVIGRLTEYLRMYQESMVERGRTRGVGQGGTSACLIQTMMQKKFKKDLSNTSNNRSNVNIKKLTGNTLKYQIQGNKLILVRNRKLEEIKRDEENATQNLFHQ